MVVLGAEVPLLRRLLLSNGVRNGSRRRRRRGLFSFPAFLVLATEATKIQASGRASPRSLRQQWPLTSACTSQQSCHNTGAYTAASSLTRGTRFAAICDSLVMQSPLRQAALMVPTLTLGALRAL